jgi:hypothetical protein
MRQCGAVDKTAPPEREVDVLRRGVAELVARLPAGWRANVAEQLMGGSGGGRADALVDLIASDGSRAVLVLEPKRSVAVRDLAAIVHRLEVAIGRLSGSAPELVPVVVARYLTPSVRSWLDDHDVSYVDATGNMRILAHRPALYLRDRGADRDPWPPQ